MIKDLLKSSIIGASIIVSTIIYSERNKYDLGIGGLGDYSVLNKKTGEVQSFNIIEQGRYGYNDTQVTFKRYITSFDTIKSVDIQSIYFSKNSTEEMGLSE